MRARRRRRRREDPGVELTPLIDVVFLLLTFFMLSTTFDRETQLQIELPEASAETSLEDSALEVVVDREGRYRINGEAVPETDLPAVRQALAQARPTDGPVALVITADEAAPHRAVVTVMDAAGQLGIERLRITTLRRSNG